MENKEEVGGGAPPPQPQDQSNAAEKEVEAGSEALIISLEEKDLFFSPPPPQPSPSSSDKQETSTSVARDGSTGLVLTMDACFKSFDKDEDLSLNINEFTALLRALFRNEKGRPYPIDETMCTEIFNIFNKSGDGSLSKEEFAFCWNNWIKKIVRPVSALIVVDVQNDFISGSLAISNCPAQHNGEEVVPPINKLVETVPFDAFYYSLDWHPADHISFIENVANRKLDESSEITDPEKVSTYDTVVFEGPPKTEQKMWPGHCVQESWGSELHKDLKVHPQGKIIRKGVNSENDSYSAFFENQRPGIQAQKTELEQLLITQGVSDVYVCGIAADICVASTAFHALELGFRTIYLENCSRGIEAEAIKKTHERVRNEHGVVIHSSEAKPMVQGRDRRVELGYSLALECRKKIGLYPPKNKNSRFNPAPPSLDAAQAPSTEEPNKHLNSENNTVKASA